ncbi:hypothetical protein M3Y98_00412800 [Aphelenchoides besseyi]|nr:hypothetical protein M3Y98_00412800 [Aphelenchoides besseyi]
MVADRTDSSSASIQLPDNGNEQLDLFNDSSAQNYGPNEVVISGTSEQNEIQNLETQLAKLSRDHAHHSAELEAVSAEDILRQQLPGCSLNVIKAIKLTVIFVALFLLIRLVFMVDVFVLLALFESTSLIVLVIGYEDEEHLFFWPFFLSCSFEAVVAGLQLFVIYNPSKPKSLVDIRDVLLTNALSEQMTTTFGLIKIVVYVAWKLILFVALAVVTEIIGLELARKKFNVAKERKCLAKIDCQKVVVERQLELLRAEESNCPVEA